MKKRQLIKIVSTEYLKDLGNIDPSVPVNNWIVGSKNIKMVSVNSSKVPLQVEAMPTMFACWTSWGLCSHMFFSIWLAALYLALIADLEATVSG